MQTRLPLLAMLLLLALTAGCGTTDADPEAQPAPDVTTFERGIFDELPRHPRSEPLGPRSESGDVVTRSYQARGASPAQVLEYYRSTLDDRWEPIGEIERIGVGTYRGDWQSSEHHLRVSASEAPTLESEEDPAAQTVVAQYSLTLRPRSQGLPGSPSSPS